MKSTHHKGTKNTKKDPTCLPPDRAGRDPTLETLRQQLTSATLVSRKYTGVGFFTTFSVDSRAPRIRATKSIWLGGVGAEFPTLKHGAGFQVRIDQGAIDMLEGFTYDEPWPDPIGEFRLFYSPDQKRDLDAVRKGMGVMPPAGYPLRKTLCPL